MGDAGSMWPLGWGRVHGRAGQGPPAGDFASVLGGQVTITGGWEYITEITMNYLFRKPYAE